MKNSDVLSTSIAIMKYTGVWKPDSLVYPWDIYYTLFAMLIQGSLFFVIVLSEIAYVLMVLGDTDKTVDAAVLLLSHLVQGVKVLTIIFRQRRIKKLIAFIDGPSFSDRKNKNTIERTVKLASVVGQVIITLASVTALFWCLVPTLQAELRLPLRTAYPYDISAPTMFYSMYIYNSLSVAIVGIGDTAENYLVAGLIILAGAHLDVLREELVEIGSDVHNALHTAGDRVGWRKIIREKVMQKGGHDPQPRGTRSKEEDNILNNKVWHVTAINKNSTYEETVECIKYHQNIIKYVDELASIFGLPIFCQFITSSVIMCMTLFKLTITTEPVELVTICFYLFCVFLELLMYCYPGDLLINKSLQVSEAAYPESWMGDVRKKKALLLTSLRSQRALVINAGGIFKTSLPTAASVVQTAYSYYAVLRQKANQ